MRRPALTVALLLFGHVATVACSENFAPEVFACEDAVSYLAECCPTFEPSRVRCVRQHSIDSEGCYEHVDHDEEPSITVEDHDCILARSCAERRNRRLRSSAPDHSPSLDDQAIRRRPQRSDGRGADALSGVHVRALAVAVALLFTAGAANADPEPSPSIRVGGGAGYGWIGISPTVPVEHLTLFGSFAVHRRDDVSIRLSAVVEPGRTPHGISMHHTSFGGGIEFHRAAFFGEVGTKLDAFVLVRESKGPSTGPAGTFDESAHFVGSLGLGTYASGGVDLGHFFVAVRIEAGVVTPLVPFAAGTALVGVSF